MLSMLRKKKTMKRLLWGLAIIIIPAFVFWGAGSALRGRQGASHAGKLFGRKISFEEYTDSFQAVRNKAIMMYGTNLNEIYESLNLENQAWQRLILVKEARSQGIKISDKEVVEKIEGFPFFQSDEKFDTKAYEMILKQVFRIEPRQFEEEIRDTLMIAKLQESVTEGLDVSDEDLLDEYKKENEKSKIAFIMIKPRKFEDDVKIDETTLKKYYEDNLEAFRVQEQLNCEYLGFEFADYQADIEATDEEIQQYYDENRNDFDPDKEFDEVKAMAKNSLILKKARDKALLAAEKIDLKLIDKNKRLEEVAKENDLTIKETGLFERGRSIPQIGWFPELVKKASRLKVGARSELIKSKGGFAKGHYIIRLKEKKASYIPDFKEVEEDVKRLVTRRESTNLAAKEANRLHRKIMEITTANEITLQEAAKQIKRTVEEPDPFTRNEYVKGLGSATELGEAAFTLEIGKISPVIRTRAGHCIFTVLEVLSVDETAFEEEKEEFSKKVLDRKKMKAINEWYTKVFERADLTNNLLEK